MKKIIMITAAAVITSAFSATVTFAAEESTVKEIWAGMVKTEIHKMLGTPSDATDNGYKETYKLSNGKTAVLQYVDDVLNDGFILIN